MHDFKHFQGFWKGYCKKKLVFHNQERGVSPLWEIMLNVFCFCFIETCPKRPNTNQLNNSNYPT